jgi:hypothetical protein
LERINSELNFRLIELSEFTGKGAVIYSVALGTDEATLFDHFIIDNEEEFGDEVDEIVATIAEIGNIGARAQFFKQKEGRPGDGVCALYDFEEHKLRLYCIRYSKFIIILGSGGKKNVRAWQDDRRLKRNAELMIEISKQIAARIQDRFDEFTLSEDLRSFTGPLHFNNDET